MPDQTESTVITADFCPDESPRQPVKRFEVAETPEFSVRTVKAANSDQALEDLWDNLPV